MFAGIKKTSKKTNKNLTKMKFIYYNKQNRTNLKRKKQTNPLKREVEGE